MRIAVGLSGGVDSSVAALLLKQQGHEVMALFMQNWHDTTGTLHGDCPWKDDLTIAQLVAKKLDIPFHFIDLSADYSKKVVDYMFAEYARGRTPNPDVLCNREIKFDVFLKAALDLGAEAVATGHYCRKEVINQNGNAACCLLAGADPNKDQSYFLCQLSQEQLSKALFPIGHLLKPDVRKLAAAAGLPSADKKDSQGICFVGKVDLPVFLQQKLAAKEGDVIEIMPGFYDAQPPRITLQERCADYRYQSADGKKAGTHQGAHFFTIGQRHGLNVGGHAEPLFVIATDVHSNTVYVGEGHAHQGLYREGLFIAAADIHWIRPAAAMATGEERAYKVRIRYRQPLQDATLYRRNEGLYILFREAQRGVTAGQFAAWYNGDELLGSGVITSQKPNL
ncbi:MAG: tRNA 2-thiouridine(34) synthase MnmA [Prevotellaceae bacterium]|jgi:tRNA-specific 2-thiouridylase|nr:tRNA 2-thiouridine(34) synthase MnmA [Prevotellaceae bacterium]